MAIAKQAVTILAPTTVPAGRTVSNPVWGPWVNVQAFRRGEWGYRVANGAVAPSVGCTIVLQTSPTGADADASEFFSIMGDTTANGGVNRSVGLGPGVMFVRVGGYGNLANDVTISSTLQAEVG